MIAALKFLGLPAESITVAITLDKADGINEALRHIASWEGSGSGILPEVSELARNVKNTRIEKFDYLLSPYLRRLSYASIMYDQPGAVAAAQKLVESDC